jgi:LysM repeat protein
MMSYKSKAVVIVSLAVILVMLTVAGAAAEGGIRHVVQYGETLFSIGRLYGVSPYQIAQANSISNPNYIYEGQVLYIPSDGYDGGYHGAPHPGYGYYPPVYNYGNYSRLLTRHGYYVYPNYNRGRPGYMDGGMTPQQGGDTGATTYSGVPCAECENENDTLRSQITELCGMMSGFVAQLPAACFD